MYYGGRETSDNLIKLEISHREKAVELIDQIIPIIKSFDGKVFNVKIENKIREITGEHICVRSDYYGRFEIEWYMKNRSTKDLDSDYGCVYVAYTDLSLVPYLPTDKVISYAETGSKRLVADALVAALEKQRKKYIEEADELRTGLNKVDEWKEKIAELKKLHDDLFHEVPYQFRNYYYEIGRDLKI